MRGGIPRIQIDRAPELGIRASDIAGGAVQQPRKRGVRFGQGLVELNRPLRRGTRPRRCVGDPRRRSEQVMPSTTVAAAPSTCATMRPANEIHAERTLSFFFFLFFDSAPAAASESCPGAPAGVAAASPGGEGSPDAAPGWSLSIWIGPRAGSASAASIDRGPDPVYGDGVERVGGRPSPRHRRAGTTAVMNVAMNAGDNASHIPSASGDCLRSDARVDEMSQADVICSAQRRRASSTTRAAPPSFCHTRVTPVPRPSLACPPQREGRR